MSPRLSLQFILTVAFVVAVAPAIGFVGFCFVLWVTSGQALSLPVHELPGFYQDLMPSLLGCASLLALSLVAWSWFLDRAVSRAEAVLVAACIFGLFYGYPFFARLLVSSHFSVNRLLIAGLALLVGALCFAIIPRRILPIWQR